MSPEKREKPRTFYLNEQHELARAEKERGGSVPKYTGINWASKGAALNRSLVTAKREIQRSADPSKHGHYFLLASRTETVAKLSRDKQKAVDGKVFETTNFAREHSKVFRRLGLDLLSVADDGSALVHMKPEVVDQLSTRTKTLQDLGPTEQARWATIERFEVIPSKYRIDFEWLQNLSIKEAADAVIEFQPMLLRSETDSLIRAVISSLHQNLGEGVSGTGTDFSGRQWVRGRITPNSLSRIAEGFYAVQALHSPLKSIAAANTPIKTRSGTSQPISIDPSTLPSIGVVDTGVPNDHSILARYKRGSYSAPTSSHVFSREHGAFVSSRIVFGDVDCGSGPPSPTPVASARYYDINVSGDSLGEIDDKLVNPAMQAVTSTAEDVRVFNLSFDTKPLDQILPVERSQSLDLVQDLDNFIFQNDILVVVAAGNSPPGEIPSTGYPQHHADPLWGLGAWSRSFNSLTCGSYVGGVGIGGLVGRIGWPSPFCRVGPGLCDSPKPDFSANGGDGDASYHGRPGLGVGGASAKGMWEDRSGSSFAAPLLAREAAFALSALQGVCERGAQPFAVTVKAFLALTAIPPTSDRAVRDLAKLTLGKGTATSERLSLPSPDTGVLIWQGVLEDEKDVVRIQVPIPVAWLEEAENPRLRLVVAWDPPVNAAVSEMWATRRVSGQLRTHPDAPAPRAIISRAHPCYPLIDRTYDLRRLPEGTSTDGDMWLIELSYEQIAAYYPAMTFPPQQRVGFAAELFDGGEARISPQQTLQSLAVTKTMNRLTVPPVSARIPVILRNPLK